MTARLVAVALSATLLIVPATTPIRRLMGITGASVAIRDIGMIFAAVATVAVPGRIAQPGVPPPF